MSRVSRPSFDWSDDSDDPEESPRARRDAGHDEDAEVAGDASADDDPDDDAEDDAEDDPDASLDPSLRSGQAFLEPDEALLEEEFPLGDGVAENAATVWCPYCGEASEVAVDPGGGARQAYVEDCPVCCRPWRVTVHYQPDGTVDAYAQTDDE